MNIPYIPHDPKSEIPRADSITPHHCPKPGAKHIHLVLLDEAGVPIAEATVSQEMLNNWQRMLWRDR